MKKNNFRVYIVIGIIFIVFSVISFVAPFEKNGVFALSYIFGVIALALQIYVYNSSINKGKDAKSKFYGFPIVRIGVIYLAVQLIISFIAMIISELIPMWMYVIVYVMIIAIAAIGCITAETMRDEIEKQDTNLKKDVSEMRALQSLSSSLVGQCNNSEIKIILQKIADEYKYSDPVSCNETKSLEKDMSECMKEIQTAVFEGDIDSVKILGDKELSLITERNRICKLNK